MSTRLRDSAVNGVAQQGPRAATVSPRSAPVLTPSARERTQRPAEVFPPWAPAQRTVMRLTNAPLPSVALLRSGSFFAEERAQCIASWYAGPPPALGGPIEVAYEALATEVASLARAVTAPCSEGGLGLRVTPVHTHEDPYADAAVLCRELRRRRTMRLRASCVDPPHPVLGYETVDQLRMVHDVLGHAALGLGFDLHSEYNAWLYLSPLFSRTARPAAFCELVGLVTTFVLTGTKPALRADLPPGDLMTGAAEAGVPGPLANAHSRH
jgi:hypothetical protein